MIFFSVPFLAENCEHSFLEKKRFCYFDSGRMIKATSIAIKKAN